MAITKYGATWDSPHNDLSIELSCFCNNRTETTGGLGRYQHFRNAVDLLWNVPDSSKKFEWHPWAELMAQKACEHPYLGIAGCASSGKSEFAAVWALVNWLAAPTETMVLVTSTSLKDSRKRIWGAISDYFRARPGLPGKLVDSMGIIRFQDKSSNLKMSDRCGISLIAGEKKYEREAVGKLVGFKNHHVLVVADEHPELSPAINEACFGNLSQNPIFEFMGLGNPSSHYDAFGSFCKPKAGWSSVGPSDEEWESEKGYVIRLDGLKSPNILAGKTKYPYLLTEERLAIAEADLGVNSAAFWRMIRGWWSPTGISDCIYSEADIISYSGDSMVTWAEPPDNVAAMDPAFTNGGDRSIAYKGRFGLNSDKKKVLQFDFHEIIAEDTTNKSVPRTHQVARKFIEFCRKHNVSPRRAAIDATGAGGPLADVLCQEWKTNDFLRVSFGGKASSHISSNFDKKPAHEKYANRMSEIWYAGRELLRSGQLKGIKPQLAGELCSRLYTTDKTAGNRIRVEPKQLMKDRVGASPDLADAALMLIVVCRERLGFDSAARVNPNPSGKSTWSKLASKINMPRRGLIRM